MINSLKRVVLLLSVLIIGCKSTKTVSSSEEIKKPLSAQKLIKNHAKQQSAFTTLQARIKVEYTQGDQSQTHTITLRMEKDKAIWINSAFSVVRAKITPEKVGFYNKLDNTYFDGDFALISDFVGTDLNFKNTQNLLLGEALFDLNDSSYDSDIHEKSYVLFPERQNALYEIFLLLNPGHFKMDSQQVFQPVEQRMLQVDYLSYQEVEKQILPKDIKIFSVEKGLETTIAMEIKSVSLNEELRFPFVIPSGFDEIKIK